MKINTYKNTMCRMGAFLLALFVFFFLLALEVSADAPTKVFKPLAPLPFLNTSENYTIPQYVNALYMITIGIGALIGVIKIALAGVKYSLSEIVTNKAEAREDIKGVLLGLILLLVPFIVLNTIYSGLTNLDVLNPNKTPSINLTKNVVQHNQFTTTTKSCDDIHVAGDCGRICRESFHGIYNSSERNCTYTPQMTGLSDIERALPIDETADYIECETRGSNYNFDTYSCSEIGVSSSELNCLRWGGTYSGTVCTSPEYGPIETYSKENADATENLEEGWNDMCVDSGYELRIVGCSQFNNTCRDSYVTYLCYRQK